jgi:hypothetical protein
LGITDDPLPNKDHILDVMKVISTISYNKLPLNNHGNEICGNVAVSKHAQIHEDTELEPRRCADVHRSNGQLVTVMTYMSSMSIS